MAFTFSPSKDWVKNINGFMADYNKFSNGCTNVGSGDKEVKRWGEEIIGQNTMTALNGCTIDGAGIQRYIWNSRNVQFMYFKVNLGSNSVGTNQALDILKLPFGSALSVTSMRAGGVGFVDGTVSPNGTLSITNVGGTPATGFASGELIFI